jgi:multisubunit Na+/H+ antiporter MnhF subunit
MSAWLGATMLTCLGLVPCAAICLRARNVFDRLIALEMAAMLSSLAMILLAEEMKRPLFFDLGLTLALLSFGGGLVFARFLERWV